MFLIILVVNSKMKICFFEIFLVGLFLFLLGFYVGVSIFSENVKEVKIGVLFLMIGYWLIGKMFVFVIIIVVDKINKDLMLLLGYNMSFLWNDLMCLVVEGFN